MPELPEVETVRAQLEPLVRGAVVTDARAHHSAKFASAPEAIGSAITGITRRGKYLLFGLVDAGPDRPDTVPHPGPDPTQGPADRELIVHLGMTGALHVDNAPRRYPNERDPYERASWDLADGRTLWFRDIRRFGRIAVVRAGDHRSLPTLYHLGPEPFDPSLDGPRFHRSLAASRRRIKTQLLSQRPIAGVGNIYADEALWRAGIHPAARRVGPDRADLLLGHVRDVLAEALDHGGTTLRDYRTPDHSTGRNQFRLDCYGRSGQPCRRCATPLTSRELDQRTATWCPTCQAH